MSQARVACVAMSKAVMHSVSRQNNYVSDVELITTICDYTGHLTRSGKCRNWGRSSVRRSYSEGLCVQKGSDLPHLLPWQPAPGYLALHLFARVHIHSSTSYHSPNIRRNTKEHHSWAMLRAYHTQGT